MPLIHCHHLQLNPRSVEASEEMCVDIGDDVTKYEIAAISPAWSLSVNCDNITIDSDSLPNLSSLGAGSHRG